MDPKSLLEAFGTIGLFIMVFAESGLLIGFFLPGDSLLFTAGLFAARGDLNLAVILPGCFIAAVAGDQVGYWFGQRTGPALFRRPDSRFFRRSHLEKAEKFFEQHGPRTIVLARFVPFVRTFAPILAGVSNMSYRTFVTFNVVGGLLWAVGVTTLGYILGESIPDIDKYLLPIIGLILLLSVIPIAREALKMRRRAATAEIARPEPESLTDVVTDVVSEDETPA